MFNLDIKDGKEISIKPKKNDLEPPQEVARLGPGDFFGETGLLEGRTVRNSSVVCTTPVEVLMIDNQMFLHLTEEQCWQ